jgi:deferrochelatase/peroxidase EfeB
MTDRLQRGIYHRSGEKAPPVYRLLLVNAREGVPAADISAGLAEIWAMLMDLREGRVRELGGQPDPHLSATRAQFSSLDALISYGRRLFDAALHDPRLSTPERPPYLVYLDPVSPFPSMSWSPQPMHGECDIALQLTANSVAAVNCAAVEVWKLISDRDLPFEVVVSYEGFGRLDGRGWLEFHDGVSNMDSASRRLALTAGGEAGWMEGGTYMVFLRIRVSLGAWRSLDRNEQEVAVGRDKLTGAALESIRQDTSGEFIPVARRFTDTADDRAQWRDPPQQADRHLERSHIHRANQSRASPGASGSFRIFRQGYEFLEEIGPTGPKLGLNFISFQRDLRVFQHVMNLPGWLSDATFGGAAPSTMLSLEAGGLYAVPAVAEPFPGVDLFCA